MKIQIGGVTYQSKVAVKSQVQAILYSYRINETINGPDFNFMRDLLDRHPEAALKIGCGVASMSVRQNGPTRGFWLTRTDGTETDFSYLSCLTAKTHRCNVMQALRLAIREQISDFREENFYEGVACAITGETLTHQSVHVDHTIPFDTLVTRFLAEHSLSLDSIEINSTDDGSTVTRITDTSIVSDWQRFHADNAQLRLVSARANLSRRI